MVTSFFSLVRRISTVILILAIVATGFYYLEAPAINIYESFKGNSALLQFIASGLLFQMGGFCFLLQKKRWAIVFCALGAYFAVRSSLTEVGWSGF